MEVLQILLFYGTVVNAVWPDCVVHKKNFDGLNKISGYRSSNEGCAHWCGALGPKCVRWVYQDSPATCFLKAFEGNEKDENDPLTQNDHEEFQSKFGDPYNQSNPEVIARIDLRQEQMLQLHTGDSTCQPDIEVPWPDCSIVGENIVDASAAPNFENTNIEDCSGYCQDEPTCQFWSFHKQAMTCWLQTDKTTTESNVDMTYGPRTCVGKVNENALTGSATIDGGWTPWSILDTPCFNKRTGSKVDCGGGIQYRHRSCTNPEPRFGGKICPGLSDDEFPCNLHNCALPDDFLWSAWGAPDILCSNGTQKRTTLCGDVRRRLPMVPGRNEDEPPVNWPSCVVPFENKAPVLSSTNGGTLEQCFNGCKGDATCNHWTFNVETKKCSFHDLLQIESYVEQPTFATGEKFCFGTKVYAPYCGEFMKNYRDAAVAKEAFEVPSLDACAGECDLDANCHSWYLEISQLTGLRMCTLRGQIPDGYTPEDVTTADMWAFSGLKATCPMGKSRPSTPEEAMELSYKEICVGNQYKEETKVNNTWNQDYCDSPCKDNGPCPAGAQCYDRSDTLRPKYECICQMGMVMEGNRCISPPPSTPTPRPVPSLSPAIKDTVTALTRTASFVLIGFVTATLVLFAVLKIMDPGRFIHMNIEIALLLAHICLLPTLQHSETACRNISIFIHFFYTAVFAFFLMEGIFMYSLVSRVVPRNGMLSNMGSFMAGWGIAITVITFTVSFEYENYGGDYQ
ncbi:uncharacterized protein LOC131891214 [Tigriopus californicus]|uniref:uncharacterized protein LOC131891214 n=1 Tax=Tigriopus californicus TaxID=6832 RepID=UPI0027DA25DF|nr:uncharacterized protein LOC131891214 [Tigriopus californicus]